MSDDMTIRGHLLFPKKVFEVWNVELTLGNSSPSRSFHELLPTFLDHLGDASLTSVTKILWNGI